MACNSADTKNDLFKNLIPITKPNLRYDSDLNLTNNKKIFTKNDNLLNQNLSLNPIAFGIENNKHFSKIVGYQGDVNLDNNIDYDDINVIQQSNISKISQVLLSGNNKIVFINQDKKAIITK